MIAKILFLAGLSAITMVPAVHATRIGASAGDGSVGLHADTVLLPMLHANADYLRTDSDRGDAKVYSAGLMIAPPTPLVHWTMGVRYQHQDTRYGSGGGVQLGASLMLNTPIPLLSVGGYGFYMPPGTAQGRVRQSHEYGAKLRVSFTLAVYAYAGYRYMRTSFEGAGAKVLYNGPALGLSIGF